LQDWPHWVDPPKSKPISVEGVLQPYCTKYPATREPAPADHAATAEPGRCWWPNMGAINQNEGGEGTVGDFMSAGRFIFFK